MNKIFKVIWSKTRNCYIVVSELAKGHTKANSTGRKARRAAVTSVAALAVALTLAGGGNAWAAVAVTTTTPEGETAIVYTTREVYNTSQVDEKLALKADATDVYTTTEMDSKLDDVNTALNAKADASNVYNKETVDAKLASKADATDVANKLALKADMSNVYNKETVDAKLDLKADTTTVAATYATKTELDGKQDKINDYLKVSGGGGATTIDNDTITTSTINAGELIMNTSSPTIKLVHSYSGTTTTIDAYGVQTKTLTGTSGVIDGSLNADGHYIKAEDTVGTNLNTLDTQLYTENTERVAADTALDTRITNVKKYLEEQTAADYVNKNDAAVQDGAVVKADKTIGENVTNLDAALAQETAARIGADAAQDQVIQQVNDTLVESVTAINTNMANGFTALNQADAAEAKTRQEADAALDTKIQAETTARVAADTNLASAVNGGLVIDEDNVLQKNTTSIDADGNVTTSKAAATTLIMNQGAANQITLSQDGIKVGLNSTVQDANGFYAGGDTAALAKAALNADGSIKGADGAFTVDTAGKVTAASGTIGIVNIEADGDVTGVKDLTASGTIKGGTVTDGAGASMTGGTVTGTTLTDGTATLTGGNLNTSGNINAHDITSTGDLSTKNITATGITATSLNTQGGAISGGAITGTSVNGRQWLCQCRQRHLYRQCFRGQYECNQ